MNKEIELICSSYVNRNLLKNSEVSTRTQAYLKRPPKRCIKCIFRECHCYTYHLST